MAAIDRKSRRNNSYSSSYRSGARRIADGCTVAVNCLAHRCSKKLPRSFVSRKAGPISDCAAVAPQANYNLRFKYRQLRLEPGPASSDLNSAGLRMNPPLAALDELEMLHRIGHVYLLPVEAGFAHRFTQQTARGANKWASFLILFIARLFPYHHNLSVLRPFAKHDLGRVLVEFAAPASWRSVPQFAQVMSRWYPLSRGYLGAF